jgi:hypothetical protein
MKHIILLFYFLTTPIYASVSMPVVCRDKNFNAQIIDKILPDLIGDNRYEGKNFKIVFGKNSNAISFNASSELQLKAATAYYHLSEARKYFTDVVHSQYVKDLPQLTIRIDFKNVFNELGHFANDNLDPQFNNALSIPAGRGYAPKNIPQWGNEIWFRPAKDIHLDEIELTSVKSSFALFRNQTHMMNFNQFFTSLLLKTNLETSARKLLLSSVIVEAIYQSSDFTSSLFERKIYRLDSALVPEIIYHEFSHIALSDRLLLTHSTPVNEGLADYFAGKISKSKKLATHIKDYNLFNGKEVRKKQLYQAAFERGEFANTDFVFGLLWNIGLVIGPENEAKFMYKLTENLDTDDSIRDGLIKATLATCKENCSDSFIDSIRLYKLFQSKNI